MTELEHKSLSGNAALTSDAIDLLRALSNHAQVTIKPENDFKSHRKLIGPLISFAKKLSFPLVNCHVKKSLTTQQEFNQTVVEALAKIVSNQTSDKR